MANKGISLQDFVLKIYEGTGNLSIDKNNFAFRWMRTNASVSNIPSITYVQNYISPENYFTELELQTYKKLKKDNTIPETEEEIDQLLSEYLILNEHEVINDDHIHCMEDKTEANKNHLEFLKNLRETLQNEINEKQVIEAEHGDKKIMTWKDVAGLEETNTIQNETLERTYKSIESIYVNIMGNGIPHNRCDMIGINAKKVKDVNLEFVSSMKLFMKTHFIQEKEKPKNVDVRLDENKHSNFKPLSSSHSLCGFACNLPFCHSQNLSAKLSQISNSKRKLNNRVRLLELRTEEFLRCLQEFQHFISNAQNNELNFSSSEMRLNTENNNEKAELLEDITKDYLKYIECQGQDDDLLISLLKENVSNRNKQAECYLLILRKLLEIISNHVNMNQLSIELSKIRNEKLKTALDLSHSAYTFLHNWYQDFQHRMEAFEQVENRYRLKENEQQDNIHTLYELCNNTLDLNLLLPTNLLNGKAHDIALQLNNLVEEVKNGIFCNSFKEKRKEIDALMEIRKKIKNLVFNGPMNQPMMIDNRFINEKNNLEHELESVKNSLYEISEKYKEKLSEFSDEYLKLERTLWIIFLTCAEKLPDMLTTLNDKAKATIEAPSSSSP